MFEASFLFMLGYLLIDVIKVKSFYLVHLWILSFIYVILSEGIVFNQIITNMGESGLFASKIIIVANAVVLLGYSISPIRLSTKKRNHNYIVKNNATAIVTFLSLLYFFYNLQFALNAFLLGRGYAYNEREGYFLINTILDSFGLILPASIAYVYKSRHKINKLVPVIVALPVFIILFLGGTRYPLLFSLVGFLVIYLKFEKFTIRRGIFLFVPTFILIIVSANIMKTYRTGGAGFDIVVQNVIEDVFSRDDSNNLIYSLASSMSPEGVVQSYSKMVEYFEDQPHQLGVNTGFVFYFWIPRSIWNDKPTMLGHWLIRKYGDSGFGSGHSASFGFAGEFYADFGIVGAILLSFLMGIGLKKLEVMRILSFIINDERKILFSMLYPYVFFAVRSPVTASTTMISILVIYLMLRRLLFIKINKG